MYDIAAAYNWKEEQEEKAYQKAEALKDFDSGTEISYEEWAAELDAYLDSLGLFPFPTN